MVIMSQQHRQFQMEGGWQYVKNNNNNNNNDTTLTKVFVGGLAWETQRDTLGRYFEQFGEIVEAVVIMDKNTGRSKGYGFVTFKDPEAAMRACKNPSPVIDGRRANCNLAFLGANKNNRPPPTTLQLGRGRFRAAAGMLGFPAAYHGSSSTIFRHPNGQYTFPYSPYRCSGYSQDSMYPLNYYSVYGGQQFSPYYSSSGSSGNIYPYYPQVAESGQASHHGFRSVHQFPQMLHFPVLQHQHHYATLSPSPASSSMPLPTTTDEVEESASIAEGGQAASSEEAGSSQVSAVKASELNSST